MPDYQNDPPYKKTAGEIAADVAAFVLAPVTWISYTLYGNHSNYPRYKQPETYEKESDRRGFSYSGGGGTAHDIH
jgi:hypothetical protein